MLLCKKIPQAKKGLKKLGFQLALEKSSSLILSLS